jgi:hypothetical protein
MLIFGAKLVFLLQVKKQTMHYFTAVTHFFFALPQYYKCNYNEEIDYNLPHNVKNTNIRQNKIYYILPQQYFFVPLRQN